MDLVAWMIPAEPSVTVVCCTGVSAVLYLTGCRRQNISRWRRLSFWLGLTFIYLVLHTQYDYYSERVFFMHRIQHSVLHHAGPFLIALSRPGTALWAGMPVSWRKKMASVAELNFVAWAIGFLNNPVVAVMAFCAVIIVWLLPPIHLVAMFDWRWYRMMNWSMVVDGLMFWNLVLNSYSIRPAYLSAGCRIAMMLAVIPVQIMVGALLFFNSHEIYPFYGLCGFIFPWLSVLLDQQIGGMILWVHGAMMSMIGILIVIYREWIRARPPLTP